MGGHQPIIKFLNYSNYGGSFVGIYGLSRYTHKFSVNKVLFSWARGRTVRLGAQKYDDRTIFHISHHIPQAKNTLQVLKERLSKLKETVKNRKEFSSWMPTGRNDGNWDGMWQISMILCTKTQGHSCRLHPSSTPPGITRHEANFKNILFHLVIVVFTQYIVV